MIAINQNYFNLNFDYLMPSFNNSFVDNIKNYIELLTKLNNLRKTLKNYFYNLDTILLINKLDTVEKIDDILINLEDLSEWTNGMIEDENIHRWYNLPIYHMVDKVEDRNMALQGLLLSKQAHL